MTWATPGSARRDRGDARGVGRGRDDLQRARARRGRRPPAPGRSATREPSPSGTTLIDGMPVFRPSTGRLSATSAATATAPKASGRRHRRSPQAAKRGERCSPECTHGSESLSTRGPSLASTAGSSVSVAARMKTTESMIPSAIDRNAGDGHEHHRATARSARSAPREQDGLAGGVHRLGDRVLGREPRAEERAAEAHTR